MKQEIKLPDDILKCDADVGQIRIIDPFWAKFILANNSRITGKLRFQILYDEKHLPSDGGFVFGRSRIMISDGDKTYYLPLDAKRKGNHMFSYIGKATHFFEINIIRNTLKLRCDNISYIKAKLKF